MKATEENIRQLLEMLDNPDAYSEQEIRDIIDRDEETREAYRLMVEAKQGIRHRQHQKPVDADAAWQRLNQKLRPAPGEGRPGGWMKMAASFIGVLLVSGIALAAIHFVRQYQKLDTMQTTDTTAVANSSLITSRSSLPEDTVAVQPVVYDNIPLEKMLSEIAAHYGAKVVFINDEARQLRFRFVWNPQKGIDQVVRDLNQFERLTVTVRDNEITVE